MKRFAAILVLLAMLACALAPSFAEESDEDMSLGDFIRSVNPEEAEEEAEADDAEPEEMEEPLEVPDTEEGEAFALFLHSADCASENSRFYAPSYAVCDIDADGVAELIVHGGEEGSAEQAYRFYTYHNGMVMDAGEIDSEMIDDWIGYSPSREGIAVRMSIADMTIYSFYRLGDEIEMQYGLSEYRTFVTANDGTSYRKVGYEYVEDGVTTELPAEEWDAFVSDLQTIEFLPFELNFEGESADTAPSPAEEDASSIGPGTLTQTQLEYLREAFEIPDDVVITDYDYNPDGSYLWEATGLWIVNVWLYSGDQCVGSALAEADTLEPVRQVWTYTEMVYEGMLDPSQVIRR